jgi:hypothetical protein
MRRPAGVALTKDIKTKKKYNEAFLPDPNDVNAHRLFFPPLLHTPWI